MRTINKMVIQPNTPNDNKVLWLNKNNASYYNNGTWVTIGKSSEDIRELEEKVDFLDVDMQTVEKEIQDINSRHNTLNTKHESLSKTVQGISATGGASTATNVTYNNDRSELNAENAQDAIDELQSSKFDKTSILQESGDDKNSVMSQKATTTAIADETTRAKAAEKAIIFDVSAHNNGVVFESISALLGDANLSTLIPTSVRRGGMTIQFIQESERSSANKYVQYRLAASGWSTDIHDWTSEDPYFIDKIMQEVNEAINEHTQIEITGDVTNAPDEEDLTSVNVSGTDVLKFKDKAYNPLTYSGMGRKILRKNIVDGINTLTQNMMPDANTIYIIQYDYMLGENITVPANCIFEFDGGSLSSGNIIFTNTLLCGNIKFSNIVATGTIANDSITPKDFGAVGDGVTDDTKAFRSAIDVCNNIHITSGIYIISPNSGYGCNDGLRIKRSNVHIKMDSDAVLKAAEIPLEKLSYFKNILSIYGPGVVNEIDTRIENITIEGGNIIGSRSQYNIPSTDNRGENYCGIGIWFCNNVTIKDCTITDCAGDAIYTAAVDNLIVERVSATRFRRGGVSVGLDNGVLIRKCNFDCPAPITYSNGNVSYPTGTPFTICLEPEPAVLREISDKPIQNVIIEDNTFIGEATYKNRKYIEGCVSGIIIRNNIFKNACVDGIHLQPFSNYNSNGICENALIEGNIIEGIVYSGGTKAFNESILATCNGNITIRNNKVSNLMLARVIDYTRLIIENNETTGWESFAMVFSNIEGSTIKAYIKGNISEANCILFIYGNSIQDIYINDNILSGSTTILDNTESFCYIGYNPSNVYIENNKATIHGRFIVAKRFDNIGKLLLNGNYFDCYPTDKFLVFDMNGNSRYVNADIINNYIKTTVNATLSVKDFTGKMSVINNVFAGAETKFTEDITDTDNLKINNNVYIG